MHYIGNLPETNIELPEGKEGEKKNPENLQNETREAVGVKLRITRETRGLGNINANISNLGMRLKEACDFPEKIDKEMIEEIQRRFQPITNFRQLPEKFQSLPDAIIGCMNKIDDITPDDMSTMSEADKTKLHKYLVQLEWLYNQFREGFYASDTQSIHI